MKKNKQHSLQKQFNMHLILVSAISIILAFIISFAFYYNLFQQQVFHDLRSTALSLKDTNFEKVYNSDELRITVIQKDGKVLYDSEYNIKTLENHKNRTEVKEAFKNGEGYTVRESSTAYKNTFYFALLLDNGNVLRIAKNASSLTAIFISSIPYLLLAMLAIFILCILYAKYMTKRIIEPINKITEKMYRKSAPYEELGPFLDKINEQYDEINRTSRIRQEFTANVSHELKTPLTAISGYSELMENNMVPESKIPEFSHKIHQSANQLLIQINDIINLSKLDDSDFEMVYEKINLHTCILDLLDDFKVQGRKHNVIVEYQGENTYIYGNKSMIVDMINNIVSNAIRYNKDPGRVWIRVENGKEAMIAVTDTGIGISKEGQQRIFERYYREDKGRSRATGGTGLGLAIVKHIVSKHDGRIEVESELNKGTTFRIYFPKN